MSIEALVRGGSEAVSFAILTILQSEKEPQSFDTSVLSTTD